MSVVAEQTDEARAPGPRPLPDAGRRLVILALVALIIAVVTISGVLAWHVAAAAARAQVVVLSDQRALTCSPASAVTSRAVEAASGSDVTVVVPAIRLNGPTTCQMRFVIANNGSHSVTVNRVHLAALYPLAGLRTIPADTGSFTVGPGDATSVDIDMAWRRGCIASGNTDSDTSTPTVSITADGLTGTITKAGPAYAVLGTSHSETDCPWKH